MSAKKLPKCSHNLNEAVEMKNITEMLMNCSDHSMNHQREFRIYYRNALGFVRERK